MSDFSHSAFKISRILWINEQTLGKLQLATDIFALFGEVRRRRIRFGFDIEEMLPVSFLYLLGDR